MPNFHSRSEPIGAVFTPLRWAKWLIDQTDICQRWAQGATVCDPTAGNGAFARALIDLAMEKGFEVTDEMLTRLVLIEQQPRFIDEFKKGFRFKYRRAFPESNVIEADIVLRNPRRRFDFLIGNPPWINFSDLPTDYKTALKPHFIEYGLVPDMQAVLLGSSRVDLAALVTTININENLHPGGKAAFFLPLSLFFNDGAHSGFRKYKLKNSCFRVEQIWDFRENKIFPDVLTRIGAAIFRSGEETTFPIPYSSLEADSWKNQHAAPIGGATAPLSVSNSSKELESLTLTQIRVRPDQKPRQGANTCGANNIFIFDEFPEHLPEEFIYPLLTKECFRQENPSAKRFILLPYSPRTGNPLTEQELRGHPTLFSYLSQHREVLKNRKGTLLGGWIKRGIWWACLGVGKYSFAPHKVVWEAYGKDTFAPKVFSDFKGKLWQPNQAMHSFMPCISFAEATALCAQLGSAKIERYLKSLNVEGTCNWAQPGRIKRFLTFADSPAATANQLELV